MKFKKKTLLFLILILFIGIKFNKIKRYFLEERYYSIFVKMGLVEQCYNPYKKKLDLFKQEGIDYRLKNQIIVQDSLQKIDSLIKGEVKIKNTIPKITHQIYFTKKERTEELGVFYTEKLKANFNRLNEVGDWQHIIWTNNKKIFPRDLIKIKGVIVKDIDEFKGQELYSQVNEYIKIGEEHFSYFAQASDMFRLMVVTKYGGIYNDIDYEIYDAKNFDKFISAFDFVGAREHYIEVSYYGNSFFAAKPEHPLILEALMLLSRNLNKNAIPDYIKYPCTYNDDLYFNGPPLITVAIINKYNQDGNEDVILPPWMSLNLPFARLKNNGCNYSKMSSSNFIREADKLTLLIKNYREDAKNSDLLKYSKNDKIDVKEPIYNNIYYNLDHKNSYPVIGADMGCGTWVGGKNQRFWYWK